MKVRLIVHGGAWSIPDDQVDNHLKGVAEAVQRTAPKLREGMTALDAVELAVNILEENPTFDAGRGAFLNEKGFIELDAMIMEGENLDYGAVAVVQNLLHPVSLARQVMEQTEHCFLAGEGAQAFARKIKMPILDPKELLTERELQFYNQIKNDADFRPHHPFEPTPMDTVGAVALDQYGNIAAATSTGGTPRKLYGRIGDSPLIGAGAYADNFTGGVSTTGWGESIMKVLLSKTVCDFFPQMPAIQAAQKGINILANRVKGLGGVIGVNNKGEYAFAHNTERMAFAYIAENGSIHQEIKC